HCGTGRPADHGDSGMIRCLLAACGVALSGLIASAQPAPPPAAKAGTPNSPDDHALVFLGDKRPVLLRLRLEVDGKPAHDAWKTYLKRWFDYLDRNGDGALDADELKNAPRDQDMLQLMRQGQFFPGGRNLRMQEVKQNPGDKLTFAEFTSYYHRA